MSNSILTSTKKSLGLAESHNAFDDEILMHINSVLSDLAQIGVGPAAGVEITDAGTTWTTLLGTDKRLNSAKSYMHKRVKLLFDPPDIGFVLTAMKDQIEKDEWRLNVAAEDGPPSEALDLIAGRPFAQTIRVKNVQSIWPTVDDLEVRAQMRVGLHVSDTLIDNLHNYMTYSYDGADLVIVLSMSGEQTRALYARTWSKSRFGYFNIIISDKGTVDSRAVVIPLMTIRAVDTTVSAGGSL